MFDGVQKAHQVRRRIVPADADVPSPEYLAQLFADRFDDCLEVQFGGDAGLDAVDERELGAALLGFIQEPLRLVEEACVLQRHAHAVGQHLQQVHFSLGERILLPAVERDDSERFVALQDRDAKVALADGIVAAIANRQCAQLGATPNHVPIDEQRLAGGDDVRRETDPHGKWFDRKALAVLEVVRHRHQVARAILERDRHVWPAEYFRDLVTNEVDDRAEIKLRRQPFLHAVDNGQFSRACLNLGVGGLQLLRALLDLLFQSLRPLRVVQCDRGLTGQHGHHVAVGVVKAAEGAVDVEVQVTQ